MEMGSSEPLQRPDFAGLRGPVTTIHAERHDAPPATSAWGRQEKNAAGTEAAIMLAIIADEASVGEMPFYCKCAANCRISVA